MNCLPLRPHLRQRAAPHRHSRAHRKRWLKQDFAKTPSDIQKLIDQAKKELANASHDGKIISRQYDNSGATTVYGKVAVQNRTSEKMDIKKVLAEPVDLKIEDKTKPTILIYHTHTTESYQMLDTDWFTKSYQTRSNLATRNMVRVGDEIVAQLEAAGFAVIHEYQNL